jgi:outer membrane protein
MKRSLLLVCLLIPSLGVTAMAQASHSVPNAPGMGAANQKIAVIEFQAAVAQTNEGQRDFANLEKKFAPKNDQLKQESDQINTLKKDLQTNAKTLTPEQRQEKVNEIQSKEKELSQQVEDARSDFQNEMGTAFNSLAQKVGAVMTAYAKEHGYSLVLDASGQNSSVLWASPSVDITKAVVAAYNAKSGVPAPPPAAPAPANKAGSGK